MTSLDFEELGFFESTMKECVAEFFPDKDTSRLLESVQYSLQSGGKRFRPALCFAAAKALSMDPKEVVYWAIALEWIHTYSLIHDDLPMMDDDDERRGLPTNHKKFDEATALLAGDSLLTESFGLVLKKYEHRPKEAIQLGERLAQGAGARGMILGQVLDFYFDPTQGSLENLKRIHNLKTGCLIGLCFEGAAILAEKDAAFIKEFREMGVELGLAFQIKDDLLDADEAEEQSFLKFHNAEQVEDLLKKISERLVNHFAGAPGSSEPLCQLVNFNQSRLR